MSSVNFLEKLLDGVEVEWTSLGDVTKVLRGSRLTKKQLSDTEKYPVFHGGLDPLGFYGYNNRPSNTVMIINVGASAGTVGYSALDFWSSDGCYCIEHTELINNRFLYYFLIGYQHFLRSRVRYAGIPTLDAIVVEKIPIPIPCPDNPKRSLEIQAEIVRILDTFTELAAELTAELTARKKQYEYYRDQLLTFEEGEVEWKPLGEVAIKISSGGTPRTGVSEYYNGDIPWLRTQEIDFCDIWDTGIKITKSGLNNSSAKMIPANCVIIAMYGATVGKIGINKIPLATNQACANVELDENLANYRYIFHYLSSQYEFIKSLGTGSQTNINAQIVRNLQIPIPPLTEQARIVSILDKFDALTTSITEGLPREIELRQKQYEYYRDMLLNFPRKT